MQFLQICVLLAVASAVHSVDLIWLAPKNLDYPKLNGTFFPEVYEDFSANLGEWTTIDISTAARGNRGFSVMDSKGIIWIMFGSLSRAVEGTYFTAVWNYNPKTDQYRYVWRGADPNPFAARNVGDLRVPNITNHPGGVIYGAAAIDNNDNIWFMSYEKFSEFWMFNTTSWMFVRMQGLDGTSSKNPSIGANPGQPGEDVYPGYIEGYCMVTDSQNNIWILGGFNGNGITNGVWHFNTTSLLWTFISGMVEKQPAGTGHNDTYYGGTWMPGCDIDENDRVWVFGGWGNGFNGKSDDYCSVWTFDTRSKREWEPEYGSENYISPTVVASNDYHPDNRPGSAEGSLFIDRRDGTLVLVSGATYINSTTWGGTNMVWLYSKSLKQWKLIHGNSSSIDTPGVYKNYRGSGNTLTGHTYPTYVTGKNFNGDVYIIGGGVTDYLKEEPNSKDIWLIPQDQCSNNLHKCDANANCVEEIIGYSCECKEGFMGDGFTCSAIPSAPVASPSSSPSSSNTPNKKTSSSSLVNVSIFVASLVMLVL